MEVSLPSLCKRASMSSSAGCHGWDLMMGQTSRRAREQMACERVDAVDVGGAGVGRCDDVAAFAYPASEGDGAVAAGARGSRHGGVCSRCHCWRSCSEAVSTQELYDMLRTVKNARLV